MCRTDLLWPAKPPSRKDELPLGEQVTPASVQLPAYSCGSGRSRTGPSRSSEGPPTRGPPGAGQAGLEDRGTERFGIVPPAPQPCPAEGVRGWRPWAAKQLDGRTFPASPPRVRALFSPGEAAPSPSRRAAPAGASCTSRGPPWSCRTMTRRARPAMSTRRSRPSPSSTPGSPRGRYSGTPRPPPRLGSWQHWDSTVS